MASPGVSGQPGFSDGNGAGSSYLCMQQTACTVLILYEHAVFGSERLLLYTFKLGHQVSL